MSLRACAHTRGRPLILVLALALFAAACANTHEQPPIEFPPNASPSRIVDSRGRLITTIADENRKSVSIRDIPVTMQQAVVAIEDARFWSHNGIDPRAIARAASANAEAGQVAEGGSTITQQYVKNAILDDKRTIGRKIEEATLALALDRAYSKEVILEQYLNTIYFGSAAYGIEAAANTYFGVRATDLTLAQAALLAGIIQAPGRYDPHKSPETATTRRNLVLKRMEDQGYITAEQRHATTAQPLGVIDRAPSPELQRYPAAHFVEEVKRWLLTGSDAIGKNQAERYNNLLRGGLTITTTIDLDVQAKAEAAVNDILPGQVTDPHTPDAALSSIEPATGFVKAMVGGHDYFGDYSYAKTNLAMGSGRQTGSAFKPIVMATALSNGVSMTKRFNAPSSEVLRIPGGGTWRVKGGGIGSGTMAECTIVSSNTCYANIILDEAVGAKRAVAMGKSLGITHTELQAVPSAVLGSNNATVTDMASVFATFANGGVHVPPVYVTKVERADGTVLYEHGHSQSKVLEPEVARQINEVLPQVISASNGTGKRGNIGRPAGGKTGSAQNNTDAWFCGYTPQLATAVWVGFAQPRPGRDGVSRLVPMQPRNTAITVFGGTYPAQIFSRFMTSALDGLPALALVTPEPPPSTTTTAPSDPAILSPVTVPGSTQVPSVTGMTRSEAQAALRRAGLEMQHAEVDAVAGAEPGRALAQAPKAGQRVRSGSTVWVEITVKPPVSEIPLPDLRGYGANQAAEELRGRGFTVQTRIISPPPGTLRPDGRHYEGGQVWRTNPAAGELAPEGKVVIDWAPQSSTAGTTTTTARD